MKLQATVDHGTETEEVVAVSPDALQDIEVEKSLRGAGVYYVWGEITGGSFKEIHQDIVFKSVMGPKFFNKPLQFVINSPGGDVDETNALLDLIANIRLNVMTTGFGECASAGAMLLAAGTKGKRSLAPSTTVMIHCYSWGSAGNHHDLVAHRRAQDAEYQKEIDFWVKHSKYKSRSAVEKHLLHEKDHWMTAREALKHGIVDRVGGSLR